MDNHNDHITVYMRVNQMKKHGHRLRSWLRRETHWRNTDEFFTALLFEVGLPPRWFLNPELGQQLDFIPPIEEADNLLWAWRERLRAVVNKRCPHYIDPGHVIERYLMWILEMKEKGLLSVP